jgi:hypothetical protein
MYVRTQVLHRAYKKGVKLIAKDIIWSDDGEARQGKSLPIYFDPSAVDESDIDEEHLKAVLQYNEENGSARSKGAGHSNKKGNSSTSSSPVKNNDKKKEEASKTSRSPVLKNNKKTQKKEKGTGGLSNATPTAKCSITSPTATATTTAATKSIRSRRASTKGLNPDDTSASMKSNAKELPSVTVECFADEFQTRGGRVSRKRTRSKTDTDI